MTFASLLPLIALVGVPIIIILYLMKPKGVRKVVPSVLLWKNAERNERSTTFSKKLIKNILMFIEIMALLFLMLAAMSPAIKRNVSGSSKSTILVIDTTGSMQFEDLIIQKRKQDTNVGRVDVIDILYNFEGLLICLAYGMREGYLANAGSSDSLYKLISRLSNED